MTSDIFSLTADYLCTLLLSAAQKVGHKNVHFSGADSHEHAGISSQLT